MYKIIHVDLKAYEWKFYSIHFTERLKEGNIVNVAAN